MTTVLTIISILILTFDLFMITPFGANWTWKSLDEGNPCYGIIAVFLSVIPLVVIGGVLGVIK